MTSYILLALLVAIVAISVIRAAKQPKTNRRRKLPSQGVLLNGLETNDDPLSVNNINNDDVDVHYETATTEEIYDVVEKQKEEPIEAPKTEHIPKEDPAPISAPKKHRKNEVLTITLRAVEGRPYKGYELLQALLTSGLRYSRTGVFHRYQQLINRDEVLFSLISAVAPGTFELPKMGAFSSPALTLFMQTADLQNPVQTYNMMLNTAKELTDMLGGQLLDENKIPLTAEKVATWHAHLKNLVSNVSETTSE